jgi:hypothetical protein
VVLSALTTAGLISILLGTGRAGAVVSAIVSTVLLAVNAYAKSSDLGEMAQKHRQSAANLWLMREKLLTLLVDLKMGEKPVEKLQMERDELLQELYGIYSNAPSTTSKAYAMAQKALKVNEELTFADKEIDVMLPSDLRRTNISKSQPT